MSSAAGPLGSKFSHVDLVVSGLDRSLAFYAGLLESLGWTRLGEIVGEAGERVVYRSVPGSFTALGLREKRSDAHGVPFDRYAVGLHHLCFDVASREVVDERAAWLRDQGAEVESGPREYDYTPGYYAVFFEDADGNKWEICCRNARVR